jgi:hypothetical protein
MNIEPGISHNNNDDDGSVNYLCSLFCPSLLETVSFRVCMLNVCSSSKMCPSAKRTTTTSFVRRDVHVLGNKTDSLNNILL